MTCTVCRSDHVDHIDHALIGGEPVRDVAGRVGLSKSSIDRHRAHVSAAVRLAHEVEHGLDLLAAARGLLTKAAALLASAEAKGDTRGAVAALRECRNTVEWLARLEGDRAAEHERIARVLAATLPRDAVETVAGHLEAVGL